MPTSRLAYIYLLVLLLGVALRLWQFLPDTSLYIDEIAVARSVLNERLSALLTGSLSGQVAPKGFLLALKTTVGMFGSSDWALRLFPLLCSLASLVLFWRIAVLLPGSSAGPIALLLFAGAAPLVSFGSQVKQYSSDVFFATLLLWLTARIVLGRAISQRERWLVAIAGAAAPWFSHPGILVVLSLAIASLWTLRSLPEARKPWIPVYALWAISAVAAAVDASRSISPEIEEYVRQVWAPGFLPSPWTEVFSTLWPWNNFKALLGSGLPASLSYPLPALYFVLIPIGLWALWRQQRELALCVVAPILAALGAATARQYPFSDRLILFLFPMILLSLGVGIDQVRAWLAPASRSVASNVLGWAAYGLLGGAALWPIIALPPVYHVEDMKPVLAYLQAERRPGDLIYAYYAAAPATTHYAAQFGLQESAFAVGGCHRGDGRRYLEELDAFRGYPRVWIIITHSLPAFQEREDILRYLDSVGVRLREFAVPPRTFDNRGFPAELYLYDLSSPDRLSRASASSFPMLGLISAEAQRRCAIGPQVMIPPRPPGNTAATMNTR